MSDVIWVPYRTKSFRGYTGNTLVGEVMWGRDNKYMACLLGRDQDGSVRGRCHQQGLELSEAMTLVTKLFREGK